MTTFHSDWRDAGFTLIEMLVATAIMMMVTGAMFSLMNPSQGMFAAQPEVMDMQQRLRIGVDTLSKDLMMAGAGTYSGCDDRFARQLLRDRSCRTASGTPRRIRRQLHDDRITVMYVPPTSAQTTIATRCRISRPSSKSRAARMPGQRRPVRVQDGMKVLIFDDTGSWDTFHHHPRAEQRAASSAQRTGFSEVLRRRRVHHAGGRVHVLAEEDDTDQAPIS